MAVEPYNNSLLDAHPTLKPTRLHLADSANISSIDNSKHSSIQDKNLVNSLSTQDDLRPSARTNAPSPIFPHDSGHDHDD
ncbi:hypothetical protein EIP91_007152 [Steccherinum ochraceum]|uniref:Uncharacterized protein n=1 Tax=Steccherinum ochraceum TaxID=92696 RepID=A0A4R0RUS7_9APHY|nr:hypothetical protein EIP91_007152 [Steccherinum ochraceum]